LKHLPFILILSVCMVAGHSAIARTWSVEQDGSGDWTTIQEAVDASASGDTIMIGAGRYSDLHPAPNGTTVVAYLADVKDLTIIGDGQDDVVIGPESIVEDSILFYFNVTSALSVSGIQMVNAHAGIYAYGNVELKNCTFDGCWIGGGIFGNDFFASDCTFLPPVPAPITTFSLEIKNSSNALVERCHFENLEMYIEGVANGTVRDCIFEHPLGNNATNSVKYVSSNGLFERNRTNGRMVCSGSSNVVLRENEFLTGISDVKLYVSEKNAVVEIYDNAFHGATFSTIYLSSAPSLSGAGNHILNGGSEYSVKLNGYGFYNNNPVVDLRNNYWGTDDSAQIDAWIYDIHDDPNEDTEVLYQPFSDVPLPVEKKSLGSFKSLYR